MGTITTAQRRLLVVNPNSNSAVTAKIRASADKVLDPQSRADVITASSSPFAIETRQDRALAEPCVISLLRQNPGYDAYVMACFDDIAVAAARRFVDAPITDALTASVSVARSLGRSFTIITTVETMVPGIRTLLARLGAVDESTVLAADIGVAEAAAGGDDALHRLDDAILRARDAFGADVIILGSGGLTGHAARLTQSHGLPVIDCIEAAVTVGEARAWESSTSKTV